MGFSRQEHWSGVPLPFYINISIQRLTESKCSVNVKNWYIESSQFFWRRQWHPTPVLLLGKSHAQGSLVGCSPWGREESDTTERLHFHFSLSCTGEGNGNPLQGSCLENPRDGGAWWAAIYGVAQNRTSLKQLSSSSSSPFFQRASQKISSFFGVWELHAPAVRLSDDRFGRGWLNRDH